MIKRILSGVVWSLIFTAISYSYSRTNAGFCEHLLREQSKNAIMKFCETYPKLEASKEYVRERGRRSFSDMSEDSSHNWISESVIFSENVFAENPPLDKNFEVRRDAFLILDYPLFFDASDKYISEEAREVWTKTLVNEYGNKVEKVIRELETTSVSEGILIWKIYNCGFVLKSSDACIAIDLRSYYKKPFTPQQLAKFVENIDALLITHAHEDHFDLDLIEAFLMSGKPVIVPEKNIFYKKIFAKKKIKLEDKYPNFIGLYNRDSLVKTELKGVKITAYGFAQGHRGAGKKENVDFFLNNVYCIKMGGLNFSHNGDNSVYEVYETMNENLDFAFATVWARMRENVSGSKPKRVITMHEMELHHKPYKRAPYRCIGEIFNVMESDGLYIAPITTLSLGEGVHIGSGGRILPDSEN